VVYAAGTPLGLDRVGAASRVAAGMGLDFSGPDPATPLALLAMRLGGYLPFGDAPARANLVAAALAAFALALLGRLCVDVLGAFRPSPHARQGQLHFVHEPLLAAGAVLAGGLSLASFHTATSAGAGAATLALLAGAWLCGLPLLRGEGSANHGFVLAGLAGLAAGVDPVAGPLLWPLAFGLWLWELRRGSRWPLLAPLVFVAALGGSMLASVAGSRTPETAMHLVGNLWPVGMDDRAIVLGTATEFCDELGVVGLLLAAMGALAILRRSPLVAFWLGFTLITALLLGQPPGRSGTALQPMRPGLPAALLAAAVPICAGAAELAARLGRGRVFTAVVLAALVVVSPALDGGRGRWQRDTRGSERLLEHALLRSPVRAAVDPGTPEMDGLFRYGAVLGLRPDLEIVRRE
ncbi:MAG TPA: hypothetical protein VF518_12215, partial [Polyangia bacterium]